jgi:hypothetical protein
MALFQLVAFGEYDHFIPENNHRHAIENMTLEFNNDRCVIPRNGDVYIPKKIMCYNCDDDFSIDKIEFCVGGQCIININDTQFMNSIIDFIEDINIDGNINKVYHLDKTKLFYKVKLISLQYHDVDIRIIKSGNCQQIKLNGEYTFLESEDRREMAQNSQEEQIKQFYSDKVENYNSGERLKINMGGNINGLIITDINPNIINSITLKLNGNNRLHYGDKLEIMMNTQRINDNTIYINLNDSHFMDDVTNSSLNTSRIDLKQLILGTDNNSINFKVGCYSNNIFRTISGMGGMSYYFGEMRIINQNQYVEPPIINHFNINIPSQHNSSQPWAKKPKLMTGDTMCPVLYEEIEGEYICCHQCHKNFDISVMDSWIKVRKNCPMCRTNWTDFTIYENIDESHIADNSTINSTTSITSN